MEFEDWEEPLWRIGTRRSADEVECVETGPGKLSGEGDCVGTDSGVVVDTDHRDPSYTGIGGIIDEDEGLDAGSGGFGEADNFAENDL